MVLAMADDCLPYDGEGYDSETYQSEVHGELETTFQDSRIDEGDSDGIQLHLSPLAQLVDDLTFKLVNIAAPSWFINIDFGVVFAERSSYDSVAACSSLIFCPNLYEVLTSPTPPSIDYFKSLPPATPTLWGVYAIVMAKSGCEDGLYIGSGTNSDYGVLVRLGHYKPGGHALPRFVKRAFEQGYHVAHRGLLCSSPIPTPGLAPRVRARFLALEALFTVLFFASIPAITDSYFEHLLLWKRDTVTWKPLCSHLPLNEGIRGDLHMGFEELELVAAKRRERAPLLREQARVRAREFAETRRPELAQATAKVREKAIAAGLHRCDVCDINLQSPLALDLHLKTTFHADRVAGVPIPKPNKYNDNLKAQRAARKASKAHWCSVCNKGFAEDWSLTRHEDGTRHKARAKKARAKRAFGL
ncbi:hypothetical protein AG0111_0g6896 [Alternaria gaisen]|uniref:Uncharacterized protein n=1 Tax=Alternaria gaisen TaxID=167740 RepID=A0ACB6FL35_9PLEO|nr:hypothetical protein AG0111_0g6896 [Alternaria gaisen]